MKKEYKDVTFYKIIRPIIKLFFKIFISKNIKGSENIPKNERIILAGNHTHILDSLFLISSTKRNIHFLAKSELWQGPKKIIFNNLGLIPVNRKEKSKEPLIIAKKYLENNCVIGIFPEGTTEKGRPMLPFKMGAVKLAYDTNTKIIPFAIKGKYTIFSKSLQLTFGKPIKITSDDLEKENEKLRKEVIKLLED